MREAREAYEGAAMLDPADPLPALNLGVLLDLYLGDPAAALSEYKRYLALAGGLDTQVVSWVTEVRVRAGQEARNAEVVP
jgi:Flp pilus assembly protein TadD